MTAPIPLAAPDGTVYAYACGRCKCPWQDDWTAGVCCTEPRCPACLCCVRDEGLCERCDAEGRRALEALACIGMAACVHRMRSVHDDLLVARSEGRWDVGLELFAEAEDALAALCGVSPETVRGWR